MPSHNIARKPNNRPESLKKYKQWILFPSFAASIYQPLHRKLGAWTIPNLSPKLHTKEVVLYFIDTHKGILHLHMIH